MANLSLPVVGVTADPIWADMLVQALTNVNQVHIGASVGTPTPSTYIWFKPTGNHTCELWIEDGVE